MTTPNTMNAEELKKIQSPLKEKYRNDAASALVTLEAVGRIGEGISLQSGDGQGNGRGGAPPGNWRNGHACVLRGHEVKDLLTLGI